ncbi:MAG TPA: hypothetical protein VEB40_02990 [Flavipsychrobacter sp.]|nr:hypothetical protein [Flavipsychrobacter sp.]
MYKLIYKIGFLGYLLLLVLSILYYKERTIFADTAYHLFEILKDRDFAYFENYRYGAFITQLFPVVASRFSLHLNTILLLHSASFILYYTFCYFLCGVVFKQYRLALVLLLFNILFVSDTFFWAISELPLGVAFMLVAFSYLSRREKDGNKFLFILTAFILVFVIIAFFHPLMEVPFIFMLAFLFLDNTGLNRKTTIACLFLFIGVYVLKALFFVGSLEKGSMGSMRNLLTMFPNYLGGHANKRFVQDSLGEYYWIPALFLTIAIVYLKDKNWRKLFFVCCGALGYLIFVNITYSGKDVPRFYVENLYLPLGIALAFPFVYDVLSLTKIPVAVSLILLIIVTSALRITNTSKQYTARLNWERSFLDSHSHQKLMLASRHVPQDTLILSWSSAYEFWLLSTLERKQTASLVIHDNVSSVEWAAGYKDAFVPEWGMYKYKDLPPEYFKFTDAQSTYSVIK